MMNKMHIYAFGSVCRGEIDRGSDVDLLACCASTTNEIDKDKYSIYQYERLRELWFEGNPFAWHLFLESKLLFTPDGSDFIKNLGSPAKYKTIEADSNKFRLLFERSYNALLNSSNSQTFHLSCIYLAIRNYATCYSLAAEKPIFSRYSALKVLPSLHLESGVFNILVRARLLSTRGFGDNIKKNEIELVINAISQVPAWMDSLRRSIINE